MAVDLGLKVCILESPPHPGSHALSELLNFFIAQGRLLNKNIFYFLVATVGPIVGLEFEGKLMRRRCGTSTGAQSCFLFLI